MVTTGTFDYDNMFQALEFNILLEQKKNNLLKHMPGEIQKICEDYNLVLAGGALTSLFSKTKVVDYDFFIPSFNKESKKEIIIMFCKYCHITNISNNAHSFVHNQTGLKFQLISPELNSGSAKEIISNFDFFVCMAAFDFKSKKFTFHPQFFLDLAAKTLNYNTGYKFPYTVFTRVTKYLNKGYTINHFNILKINLTIANLKIENTDDLLKQLGGFYLGDVAAELNDIIEDSEINQLLEHKVDLSGLKETILKLKKQNEELDTEFKELQKETSKKQNLLSDIEF